MHVTLVHVNVKPENVKQFIEATRLNHEGSIREPGCKRFDVLQSPEDPAKFILYEAFTTKEDGLTHKGTPHYLTWRSTVEPWMAEPRKGVVYNCHFPK